MAPVETIEVALPTLELPTEDGVPLETSWHRMEINLLIEVLGYYWRQRSDFYCGGNMFLYYSLEQVRHRDYRGPDFFVVLGVDGSYLRKAWVVWEEGGRYPNLIIELLSTSTAQKDKTVKKALYEQTFRTPEYYCYDPERQELMGWRLVRGSYEPIEVDARGWLWSEQLGLWLGRWEGEYQEKRAFWLRFYDAAGNLVPLRAEAEARRAEAEARRAEAAEAELAQLRVRLAELEE